MLDPKFFTDMNEMHQLRSFMRDPCPIIPPKASIKNWGIIIHGEGTLRMQGLMSGCLRQGSTAPATEPIWQLLLPERLVRTTKTWITLERGYHEGVAADVEIEAIGPKGHYIAPCVAVRYLEILKQSLEYELRQR